MFRPGEVNEVTIRFRPDGAPNGFAPPRAGDLRARRRDEGARPRPPRARSPRSARAADWKRRSSRRTRCSSSRSRRGPTGRVDHTFVYQRAREARRGAHPAAARRSPATSSPRSRRIVHVPGVVRAPLPRAAQRERHDRRRRRASPPACSTASAAASSACCGSLRRHWLVCGVRRSSPGFVVGGLMAATTLLARAPAAWFGFDTAQSATTFWLRQAGAAAAVALGGGLALRARVHGGGEPRRGARFRDQPQLWRVWSREGGADARGARDARVGGYLFVPLELALVAAFYYATNRWLGWWQPSEVADRSQHPGVRGAGADADRACRCRRDSWRSACSARCRWRSAR